MSPATRAAFRRHLLQWFAAVKRDLPWRHTRDPYRVWLSEIMLQQTRVATAEPYYLRFLARFPTVESLAAADEPQVLTEWAGLGYYTRARNLHKAAIAVAARGSAFPDSFDEIRNLPGVGDYTAAAVASIAFSQPRAAVDGNVLRVLSRLNCEPGNIGVTSTQNRLRTIAGELLDRARPGDFNQAMMELGATVCVPREPRCGDCPVANWCEARRQGRQQELPVKPVAKAQTEIQETLLLIERRDSILLWQRPPGSGRMAGFWELPDSSRIPQATIAAELGIVRHTITFHNFTFRVCKASISSVPEGFQWMRRVKMNNVPVSTIARKALRLAGGNTKDSGLTTA